MQEIRQCMQLSSSRPAMFPPSAFCVLFVCVCVCVFVREKKRERNFFKPLEGSIDLDRFRTKCWPNSFHLIHPFAYSLAGLTPVRKCVFNC
mmetsp:Transcript_5901/g.11712  ORF Transcript_5901/g.11712 Transcript_5901/m.11712 type:complete len:91 (-) Transcript_5901:865-1137(-)